MTDKITTLLDSNKGLNLSLESTNEVGYPNGITYEKQKEDNNSGDTDFTASKDENALDPDTILSMTLSGIFEEIRSQEETNIASDEQPSEEEDNLDVDSVNALDPDTILSSGIYDDISTQEETDIESDIPEPVSKEESTLTAPIDASATAFIEPKNENTLSIDNNVNALSINIVVAFCWWAVNYVIESVIRNICNYLKETPIPQEHTEPRFPFDLEKMKANEPAAFEAIMIGKNINEVVEIGDMSYMVDAN
ncbi:MAG TPA: hypothetical protein LFW20_02880 [Rickettsia endosymbiont of Omalisus fontisbellaquei]|nr:hypothetical protein [Rickettsia endosymbiont of Omalisus fontisbellaquei]